MYAMTAFAAAAALSPLSAVEVTPDCRRTVAVSSKDLDLTRTADVDHFHKRIARATRIVCAPLSGRTVEQQHSYAACLNEAKTSSRARAEQIIAAKSAGGDQLAAR